MSSEGSQQTSRSGRSFRKFESPGGTLLIVGVPIGHPEDITRRALAALRTAKFVASENPAATQTLLRYHNIHTQVTSYGPVNLREKVAVLIRKLEEGACIALVSDCGSPVIDDPGSRLIAAAQARSIPVRSVPGPSAVTTAIAAAGLPDESWIFGGRLPESPSALNVHLAQILERRQSTVVFCAEHSLPAILLVLAGRDPQRQLYLVCNMTTPEERTIRGRAARIQRMLESTPATGAITLIVTGRKNSRATRRAKKRGPVNRPRPRAG